MTWFRKRLRVSDQDVEQLKTKSADLAKRMAEIEKATLDGEEHWMFVKCKPKAKADHPLRRESDVICVT